MNRLRRFLNYPFRFQRLLAEAFFRLVAASLLLRLLPSSRVCRTWTDRKSVRRSQHNACSAEEICRAVTTASRYVRGVNCLPQSIVGRAMLLRAGYPAEIRLGVAKMPPGFEAHAWVYSEGLVMLGGSVMQYTELPIRR
ncbi:MAG: lasso peptide biosynthesis B2 protein [Acidobacteriia bacterium]|nr:lasso peptide biosynthesis B2 protein [Terriglobia bacterium]